MPLDFRLAYAYACGYYDGRAAGVDQCPDSYTDEERHCYLAGYERGVADYCEHTHAAEC